MSDLRCQKVYTGKHKGICFEISNFESLDNHRFNQSWCSYILLTEELHEKYKQKINDLPWNGGQTYYRKKRDEMVFDYAVPLDENGEQPQWTRSHTYYKIGDDFQHLWDIDREQSLESIERHIKEVIESMLNEEIKE